MSSPEDKERISAGGMTVLGRDPRIDHMVNFCLHLNELGVDVVAQHEFAYGEAQRTYPDEINLDGYVMYALVSAGAIHAAGAEGK